MSNATTAIMGKPVRTVAVCKVCSPPTSTRPSVNSNSRTAQAMRIQRFGCSSPDRPSTHLCGPVATDDLVESLLRQDILFFPVNKLFRRSVYGHDIKYSVHNMLEDAPMTVQLAYYCRSWGFVDEYLYNYCYRPGSVTDAEDTPEKLWQMKANVDMVISFLEGKGLSRKYRKAIITLKDWMRSRGRDLPRSYYMKLYPEINIPFLFDRDIPVMERLGHLTTLLGIHGISKPFRRK